MGGRGVGFAPGRCSGADCSNADATATSMAVLADAGICLISPEQHGVDIEDWRNGAFLVDKPYGWTSFDVCNKLRNALSVRGKRHKVGHAGTLDPLATGLLIITTGRATKTVESFVGLVKVYKGTLRLGEVTPSYDSEFDPTEQRPWSHITDKDIDEASQRFLGSIEQLPPMYSAVKVKGKKLYKLARKGIDAERPSRKVFVSEFKLHRSRAAGGQDVDFHIMCSKGTYIRSLAHDLGQDLGCGAHVRSLRRVRIGELSVDDAWDVERLAEYMRAAATGRAPSGTKGRNLDA